MDRSKLKEEAHRVIELCEDEYTIAGDQFISHIQDLVFQYKVMEGKTEEEIEILNKLKRAEERARNVLPHDLNEQYEIRRANREAFGDDER